MVSKFLTILDFIEIPASICAGFFGLYLWLNIIVPGNNGDSIFCGLVFLPLFFGCFTGAILGWLKERALTIEFSKTVAKYSQIYLKGNVLPLESTLQPYIRGRILPIIVSTSPHMFAELYYKLPRKIRALNHDDVGTIVFISETTHQVGKYDDGCAAFVLSWHICIFDAQLGIVIEENNFRGGDPPQTTSGGARTGSSPGVVGYLSKLPRVSKGT